jgi:hypothetical protein
VFVGTVQPIRERLTGVIGHLSNRVNDYSLKTEALAPEAFRVAKARVLSSSNKEIRDAFSWKLHDVDGRGPLYQDWQGEASVRRWLLGGWHRPHHFVWNRPSDNLIHDLEKKIIRVGQRTWRRMFRRYWIADLKKHDLYSLPDVYYCSKILGRIPDVAIDVGGGWGRLGMAWAAIGCSSVAVVDSIEQPYVLQHLYLRAVPEARFQELLDRDEVEIDLLRFKGITHFPLWQLPRVKARSVDVVSGVQILREVSRAMIFFLVDELKRVLRPGGIFYVRDNDHTYSEGCMHDVKITEYLLEQGFTLALDSSLVQGQDIHGVPRIFRWGSSDETTPWPPKEL